MWGVKRHPRFCALWMQFAQDALAHQRRGMAGSAPSSGQAGASVRMAALSLAERARGLAASSSSPAVTGRWLAIWKLGANFGDSPGGRWREPWLSVVGAPPEEALDDAVLQRMEGDDGEPPARLQHALGGGEALRQLAQLVVHVDSAAPGRCAWPRAGRRSSARPSTLSASSASSDVRVNGFSLRRGDDGAGDRARAALVAQVEEDVGEVRIVFAVLTMSAAVGPSFPCACRAARRSGRRSRARGRRAAWRRRRCRARRRRPAQSRRRFGDAVQLAERALRRASGVRRFADQGSVRQRWRWDRGRWRGRARRRRRSEWRPCSRRRRRCRQ